MHAGRRSTLGGGPREQANPFRELVARGVKVYVGDGRLWGQIYTSAGRSNAGGRGSLHSKVLRAGQYLLMGPTTWTVASKGNLETSVLLDFCPDGKSRFDEMISVFANSVLFTPEMEGEARPVRGRRSRSVSASSSSR